MDIKLLKMTDSFLVALTTAPQLNALSLLLTDTKS